MQRAYIDYAMAVIVGRALPDVRDGLKPVHRRVLYAMYDGGYRPDRGFSKCSRVVGDVMGQYHPHGDTAIYDTLVRLAQPWVMRAPLIHGQGNFGSPGNDAAAAMRYTECRMAPLALEMVRDIDEDTVDFQPNYDGRSQEPTVLPARYPNLLVNGSAGIAVGMATSIPPHNLREVAEGAQWALEHPDATREELQDALIERIKGPDFPNGALIVGREGIEQAYRTGRGSITQRAVIEIDEDAKGRTCLSITELPYMVNPDNLALKIAELADSGKVQGIADVRDDSSGRTGQRLVVVLKRDAVARVVLNNLLKHTELQTNFSANMLALVDGVPRTLTDRPVHQQLGHPPDRRHPAAHARTACARPRSAPTSCAAWSRRSTQLDEVIALIRRSPDVDDARQGLIELLEIDELQANAILDMQLRRLAALERQKIIDDLAEIELDDRRPRGHPRQRRPAAADRRRGARRDRREVRQRPAYPDHRGRRRPLDGGPDPRRGARRLDHPRRLRQAHPRRPVPHPEARRQGRARRDAARRRRRRALHRDHQPPLAAVLHHRRPGLPHQGLQPARGLARRQGRPRRRAAARFQPDENIAQVLAIRDYEQAPYLVLATRNGLVKKTRLGDYNSPRQAGVIAINFREDDDELIGAELVFPEDEILLVSRKGQAIRFRADDAQLRPMGRATSGVTGMKYADGDSVLSMSVIRAAQVAAEDSEENVQYVFTMTDGGFAKRTRINEYRLTNRGAKGVKAMTLANEERGVLVGAFIVEDGDEILSITQGGQVVRSPINENFRPTGRSTMGVKFVTPKYGDAVAVVARSVEAKVEEELEDGRGAVPRRPRTRWPRSPSARPTRADRRGGRDDASTPAVNRRMPRSDATIDG